MATTKIAVTAAANLSLGGGDTAESLATQLSTLLGALPVIFNSGPASATTSVTAVQAALDIVASALSSYGNATVSKTTA